jgi:hypothetical protein
MVGNLNHWRRFGSARRSHSKLTIKASGTVTIARAPPCRLGLQCLQEQLRLNSPKSAPTCAGGQNAFIDYVQGCDQNSVFNFQPHPGADGKTFCQADFTISAHIHHRFLMGIYSDVYYSQSSHKLVRSLILVQYLPAIADD